MPIGNNGCRIHVHQQKEIVLEKAEGYSASIMWIELGITILFGAIAFVAMRLIFKLEERKV